MLKANLTTRAIAAFIDLLIVIGLTRLPDVIGFLSATGYLLIRDGLFERQSVGKKLIGLRVIASDEPEFATTYRESIIRNVPLVLAYLLFQVPYAGWVLGSAVVGVEFLTALGDRQGMRVGDMLARTAVVPAGPAGAAAPDKTGEPPDLQQGG